jgi:hypothetical protein
MRWTDASFPDAQTTKKDVYVITEANKEKRGKRERDKEREREKRNFEKRKVQNDCKSEKENVNVPIENHKKESTIAQRRHVVMYKFVK